MDKKLLEDIENPFKMEWDIKKPLKEFKEVREFRPFNQPPTQNPSVQSTPSGITAKQIMQRTVPLPGFFIVYISYVYCADNSTAELYSVNMNKQIAYDKFKDELRGFIEGRPDDTYSLVLREYQVSDVELKKIKLMEVDTIDDYDMYIESPEARWLATFLERKCLNTLKWIDSIDLYDDIAQLEAQASSDDSDECWDRVMDDDDLFNQHLETWIKQNLP